MSSKIRKLRTYILKFHKQKKTFRNISKSWSASGDWKGRNGKMKEARSGMWDKSFKRSLEKRSRSGGTEKGCWRGTGRKSKERRSSRKWQLSSFRKMFKDWIDTWNKTSNVLKYRCSVINQISFRPGQSGGNSQVKSSVKRHNSSR